MSFKLSLPTRFNKVKHFLLILFLLSFTTLAQLGKEAWHWQFGVNAAIDFSSGIPATGTCSINAWEGSASISNQNTGQLLFYTDGTKVWDKNNNQMPNGFGLIGGQGTSTQSSLIIPKPGSNYLYYLISADQGGYLTNNTGIHYSIIDMNLNGGLGDVVPNSKNILLTPPPTTEKITAIRHCNGIDYWIIVHPFNSNAFNAYLVTSAGINSIPIISDAGTSQNNISGHSLETTGYLKGSPNGRKIVCLVPEMNFFELFDFNNLSGVISNPIKFNIVGYGASFSPDNQKLYISCGYPSLILFQYDISSNNESNIIASQANILNIQKPIELDAMQLAPDGKIYISRRFSDTISIINTPNNLGTNCNFQIDGIRLPVGSSCDYGLPNFIDANNIIETEHFQTELILPNIVTPNNDGLNDFIDFSSYQFTSLQIEIYNRWGIKVFESLDANCIWKPTEDNGIYFYTLHYKMGCGNVTQSETKKGFFTIIR